MTSTEKTDWGFRVFVGVIAVIAAWLIAMPWVPAIAKTTMNRFHLRTSSFAAWAIQQPIPPMYNFRNTTQIRSAPPMNAAKAAAEIAARETAIASLVDPLLLELDHGGIGGGEPIVGLATPSDSGILAGRTLNHFPTREFTFANGRARFLVGQSNRWFVLTSTYRGQTVRSVYELRRDADGIWIATRLPDETP